jgi:hypothetical protein
MRILICPLDWGMGHTTRMLPIASELLREGHEVVFGGSERQLALVKNDLPAAGTLIFAGFTTRYSKVLPMYLYTLFRVPAFITALIREHRQLKSVLSSGGFDMVISDNRMGLWNKSVKTIYITHMLRIPMPLMLRFLEPIGVWIHRQFINKYDECHIPDSEGESNLSGRLAHKVRLPNNARYTGILSKFSICKPEDIVLPQKLAHLHNRTYSVLILSGPEPQRGLLRKTISSGWHNRDEPLVILEGNPSDETTITVSDRIISVSHLTPAAMAAVIMESNEIFSRSGYTTIMELASLNRLDIRATLIATPGQTEQEYLSRYISNTGL